MIKVLMMTMIVVMVMMMTMREQQKQPNLVSDSESNLSETILEPSRAQVGNGSWDDICNDDDEDDDDDDDWWWQYFINNCQAVSVEDARSHAETQTALRGIRFIFNMTIIMNIITFLTSTQVLELGPQDWAKNCALIIIIWKKWKPRMRWYSANDALMKLWKCAVHLLMMHWWCTYDALMMRWWCTDDALMMHWWCADDALMMPDRLMMR